MRSIFSPRCTKHIDAHETALFDERSFYFRFCKDLKAAKTEVIIESPFLTQKRTTELHDTFQELRKRGVAISVYTREPNHHEWLLRKESNAAIKVLRSADVRVFLCSDMRHRKLAIIDNNTLWEGSLNILSQSKSRELMRRTNSRALCLQILAFTGLTKKYW